MAAPRAPARGDRPDPRFVVPRLNAVELAHGPPQPGVTDAEDVVAAEGEDQKHLHRPGAEALDAAEGFRSGLVVAPADAPEVEVARISPGGKLVDERRLAPAQAERTEPISGERRHVGRLPAGRRAPNPPPDRRGGGVGELLADDDPTGGLEIGPLAVVGRLRADRVDDAAHDRIFPEGKIVGRARHGRRKGFSGGGCGRADPSRAIPPGE